MRSRFYLAVAAAVTFTLLAASSSHAITVLFVGGQAGPTQAADDNAFAALQARYGAGNVSYIQASAATTASADGFDVLVVSSTPSSGHIRNKWHNSSVGIVNWEEAVMDSGGGEYGLSSAGITKSTDTTQLTIDLAHPITKGLSGTVDFVTSGETLSTTTLAGSSFSLASVANGTPVGNSALFAVEAGGAVGTSSPVEGRRVMFPITDSTFANLTSEGQQLFVQSVDWAAGIGTLAQWTFPTLNNTETGAGFQATTVATGVTAGDVSGTASTITALIENPAPNYSTQPVLRVQPTNGNTSITTAVNDDKYFEFSVAPGSGNLLELTSVEFDAARGGGGTPRGWGLASSLDGFATILDTQAIPTVRPDFTHYRIALDPAIYGRVSDVTFRMYVFSPGNGSTVEFDNLTVNGLTRAIPEPASAMLGLVGLGALAARRRRAA